MKLLVEIPNYRYRAIKEIDLTQRHYQINERSAIIVIQDGQPLPEDCEILTKEAYSDLCLRAAQLKTDVLDKIRAEIEQEYIKFRNMSDMWNERACGLGTALEIIDKYKAESEGGEEHE